MNTVVSITSQGQITLPADFRRVLGLDAPGKALVTLNNSQIIIEPTLDFIKLKGSLRATKKVSPKKERQAFIDYLANRSSE